MKIRSFTVKTNSIIEEWKASVALLQINLERDYLVYFDIYGEGINENPKGVLSIDQEGTLFVHKPVDYEEKTVLKVALFILLQMVFSSGLILNHVFHSAADIWSQKGQLPNWH